ncbi:NAD(P)-dependent dehydrogenase, short-chain alcohol dehydrogenase family [Actinomadura meyerae]|uniref:NAD(P)-dependent dehydrogenase, short-chain alcohol dehydrogenase family n=1 Tax=Actinomadura meyerae TaxID=240840 RepID=A0A239NVT5_9ACTN|nr:SDR family NAD(P)-dependent oxidoreductase [Actinomadura meyerae]SNT58553.1 NAD(P)-dependent dehydrogenase, short-chain alcohol dehydrogenase family [Actinomadura meyerae]
MNGLEGRVAVVTGAGRGIGAGIARLFAQQGAAVVVNDLGVDLDGSGGDAGPAAEVAAEITRAGGSAVADHGDVSRPATGERLVRTAVERFGRLDVLVNAAGILRDRMIFNMSEEEWDDVVRVHLKGHFNTIKPAAAHWRERRGEGGHFRIINFTSVSGLRGAPGQPNYAAAKMGIVGLTYSCANSLARYGVTANAISPVAATRMTASIPSGRKKARTVTEDERAAENVAPVAAYLASEASDWLTGRVIGANGYDVTLYSDPEPLRVLSGSSRWDAAALGESMERLFRPVVTRAR